MSALMEIPPCLFLSTPLKKYSAECVLRILLDPNIDICSEHPVNIRKVVIDLTKLAHEKDVLKDEFGIIVDCSLWSYGH